ncbi:MAG: plasmid stabilization protein [Deltaproteobacteria bacterium]|nr:plasmid stabilization protein [Deltaproteobacteria bacterium]
MPRGDKSKYTSKQQRQARHIEDGYEKSGVSAREAEKRAWAIVNKKDGGGKRTGGSGRAKKTSRGSAAGAKKSSANRISRSRRSSKKRGTSTAARGSRRR